MSNYMTLHQHTLTIQDQTLFTFPTLHIHSHEKIGIIGANGIGKSVFLRYIHNQLEHSYLFNQLHIPNHDLSGGELAMHHIHHAIQSHSTLLLLDEPTNDLDTAHRQFLKKQLHNFDGACLMVSHDREFLDDLVTKIWFIHQGVLTEYIGNYSSFDTQYKQKQKEQHAAHQKYIKEKEHLQQALQHRRLESQKVAKIPTRLVSSEKKAAKKAKVYYAKLQKKQAQLAKNIENRIARLQKVDDVKQDVPLVLNSFLTRQHFPRYVIKMDNAQFSYGDRTLWKDVTLHIKFSNKIGVIGDNGVGKTTFLKQIMQNDCEQISIHPSLIFGYFQQNTINSLQENKTLLDEVMSTSIQTEQTVRQMLQKMGFRHEDLCKQIMLLSGGERVKCCLVKLMASSINALLLDEPTNHLDLNAIKGLEGMLKHFNGLVIAVSHDKSFLNAFTNKTLHIQNETIREDTTSHSKTDKSSHTQLLDFQLTKVLSQLSLDPNNLEYMHQYEQLLALKKKQKN